MTGLSPPDTHDTQSPSHRPIRLLVLDIDGTVSNSHHEIAAGTVAAVARVRSAGIGVVLASGRRYRDILQVAAALGIDTPLITASGALVKRPSDHVTIFRAAFEPPALAEVLGRIVARGLEPILYTDNYSDGFDFHCRRLPDPASPSGIPGLAEYLVRNQSLARLQPNLDRSPPEGVFAGFTMGPRTTMLELEAELNAACPGRLSLHVIRSPRYLDWMCEIAPAAVNKWTGVMSVAAGLGIEAEAICAVGDDVNDLPMICAAGLGIAMGNATAEVLAAADWVVAGHDDGGIEEVAGIILRPNESLT
ncbi:MAG: haloacid dehalogenase [Planctomycetota bacterium]|nr:MAG: haloacid dehalogenase [Planctomycetota bacterium]